MNDAPRPALSIVLPVYRNAETLVELHRRLTMVADGLGQTFEIIFVDDHCPAGSWSVIQQLREKDARVHGLALARNVGQQRAVFLGLRAALGEAVVVLDADLQDPPEAIPALLAELGEGKHCQAVFAARRGAYQAGHRLMTSQLFKSLISLLTGVPPDSGMYVALSRRMVGRLLAMNEPNPYLVGMIGLTGLPLCSVPVERSPRPVGESAYTAGARLRLGLQATLRMLGWRIGWRPRLKRGALADVPAITRI